MHNGPPADDSDNRDLDVYGELEAAVEQARLELAFGERVREARQLLGMTQRQLGNAVGLDASAISRLEQGSRAIRLGEAARISKALKADIRQLLYGQPSDDPRLMLDSACDELEGATLQLRNATYAADVSLQQLQDMLQSADVREHLSISAVDVDNVIRMCTYAREMFLEHDHIRRLRQISADLVDRNEPVLRDHDDPDA
jgi:transcriptional regulator with XRE-family HTH domain